MKYLIFCFLLLSYGAFAKPMQELTSEQLIMLTEASTATKTKLLGFKSWIEKKPRS